jgi:hypothetical protein
MSRLILMACALLAAAGAGADSLRDPTRPPTASGRVATTRVAPPVLSAVLSIDGARSAIFNGRLVHMGAVVDGYTIEEVLADGVRIRHAGVAQELHLPQPMVTIKKPAAGIEPAVGGAK